MSRIKTARLFRKISQAELARKTEICYASISRMESGLARPSRAQLVKIAEALHVPVDFLASEEARHAV